MRASSSHALDCSRKAGLGTIFFSYAAAGVMCSMNDIFHLIKRIVLAATVNLKTRHYFEISRDASWTKLYPHIESV